MTEILAGDATDAQIAAYIVALRMKGEAVEEVSGMVDAMLEAVRPDRPGRPRPPTRSTSWAPVAAPAGGPTPSTCRPWPASWPPAPARRCASTATARPRSTSGSFDLLEALGVGIDLDGAGVARCVAEAGRRVLLRPGVPSRPCATPVRCGPSWASPRVFNFIGPLSNPARVSAPGHRRERPGHGPHGGRGAAAARLGPGHGGARPRRHGRAHRHRALDRAGRFATATSSQYDLDPADARPGRGRRRPAPGRRRRRPTPTSPGRCSPASPARTATS